MATKINSPIENAAQIAGGVSHLADACGVSKQAVYKWIRAGFPPSFDRCIQVEEAVRGKVSRFDLLSRDFKSPSVKKKASKAKTPR